VCLWNGASISGSALVLGGFVISTKEKSARWKIWPRRKEVEESEVYGGDRTSFSEVIHGLQKGEAHIYMGCRWTNHI
jgi:hypothetical protein